MSPFTVLEGQAANLPFANIDTDIIFPARFLLHTEKKGLGRFAFHDWRFTADGADVSAFAATNAKLQAAQILVTGPNFGCGSSRENAPWALEDLGIRCIVAESFGEIFFSNCFRNGMLPIALEASAVARLSAAADAGSTFHVDLNAQRIAAGDLDLTFAIEPRRRDALLNGWNETSIIMNTEAEALDAFDRRQRAAMPWLFASTPKG